MSWSRSAVWQHLYGCVQWNWESRVIRRHGSWSSIHSGIWWDVYQWCLTPVPRIKLLIRSHFCEKASRFYQWKLLEKKWCLFFLLKMDNNTDALQIKALNPSINLSFILPVCQSFCLSLLLFLTISESLSIGLFTYQPYVFLYSCLPLSLSLFFSTINPSVCASNNFFISLTNCLSFCLTMPFSVCLTEIYLTICLYLSLSNSLSVSLYICLFVSLYIIFLTICLHLCLYRSNNWFVSCLTMSVYLKG